MRLIGADGFDYGEVEICNGEVLLGERQETEIWGRLGGKLHRSIEHGKALRSRNLHWTSGGDGPTLDDGTPVTDEIMEFWGWRKVEDGWVNP